MKVQALTTISCLFGQIVSSQICAKAICAQLLEMFYSLVPRCSCMNCAENLVCSQTGMFCMHAVMRMQESMQFGPVHVGPAQSGSKIHMVEMSSIFNLNEMILTLQIQ